MPKGIDVVCVGSATIDVFVMLHNLQNFNFDKFSNQVSFPLGDKVPLDEYKLTLGGNACNVSVGLSRLGFKTALAAEIGSDEFSQKIENVLSSENVSQDLVDKKSRTTPFFNIILSYDGERTILEEKMPSDQNVSPGNLNPKLIYLTSMMGNWRKVYEEAFTSNPNSKFVINPGTRQIENGLGDLLEILPKIEVLFVNVNEAQKLTNNSNPDIKTLLSEIKKLGPKISVVTDGRNGSYSINSTGNMFQISSATQSQPKERTGAGDSYATGFLFGLINGQSIDNCMKYGSLNADSVIEYVGAQEGLLTKSGIEEEFNKHSDLRATEI